MPVSSEAELALPRFVEVVRQDLQLQNQLNEVDEIETLRGLVQAVEPSLTGSALIPTSESWETVLSIRPCFQRALS